ncbi:ANTAR domain-containing protein [Streptomyces boninensis]|uniref:ANTAR domain-containing protein n=1 Tax=Streptomyces boninensis TaxID=2039455 RepID=UPI003B223B9C
MSVNRGNGTTELLRHTTGIAAELDDLQFAQGQGPAQDAARTHQPVLEPDLTVSPDGRWPDLLPGLHKLGVRAVFAFPLSLGLIHLGAVTGHRTTPGLLTPQQTTDAVALSLTLTHLLADLATRPDGAAPLTDVSHLHRAVVHQATGMLAVQLDLPPADALIRIRAHAYRHSRPILDTARDILTGDLTLGDGRSGISRPGS